jgi:hypothetical protein
MAARSGVSTRDLMARMGHDSVRAAIIYQHATTEADAKIAAALDAELASGPAGDDSSGDDDDDGPTGVLVSCNGRSCGTCVARMPDQTIARFRTPDARDRC